MKESDRKVPMKYRTEHDSMGEVKVPADALYGAQTQRAIDNFHPSGRTMPNRFVVNLAIIKSAAAEANASLGLLSKTKAKAIQKYAGDIAKGKHAEQFPIDVFQTGSGTSTNMNMNEVIAHLAGKGVHPNDDVNQSQSSNDVIPTCIQVSAAVGVAKTLQPAIAALRKSIQKKAKKTEKVVKTGRTHLMDAMPLTMGQELIAYDAQLADCAERLEDMMQRLCALPLGGTAVGTGINCPPGFPESAIKAISKQTGIAFTPANNKFSRMAAQDCAVECSSALRGVAVVLMKIANDLRWMSSGPLSGLSEIELKALQPGSSIMPGKVNPVVPEAVAMVAAEVMGNDVTIGIAGQSGNFQLNVMLPLVADKVLSGIDLISNSCEALADTIATFKVNAANIADPLERNPILVTALNSRIGYEAAAAIAKKAYAEQRPIIEVAAEETDIPIGELKKLMDPARLTQPDS
jgi:fumarate hydratase class II